MCWNIVKSPRRGKNVGLEIEFSKKVQAMKMHFKPCFKQFEKLKTDKRYG